MNFESSRIALTVCALTSTVVGGEVPTGVPDWGLGPFVRPEHAQPVIRPDSNSVFNCPMRKVPVNWETRHTFNPAAVVKDGQVYVIYRAEDASGRGIGRLTSRLGLAWSDDGINFKKFPEPVIFPTEDSQKANEWEGGCEDPRVVETEDGSYVLFYTMFARGHGGTKLGMATSKDLINWTKVGPLDVRNPDGKPLGPPHKSASLVCKVAGDRLIAARINGRYWLYVGEGSVGLLSSADFKIWEPVKGLPVNKLDAKTALLRGSEGPKDTGAALLVKRAGKMDSGFPECGPPALLTDKGIVLLYNAKNSKAGALKDIGVGASAYSGGQALFSATDPGKLLDRTEVPFVKPEMDWEKSGQYASGTTFLEGLVLFKGKWFLYYGCADTFVGVAIAPTRTVKEK